MKKTQKIHGDFTKDEPWRIFRIRAEFVEGFETLSHLGPAVCIFGSSRSKKDDKYYKLGEKIAYDLAESGYAIITGGGPGIMEAANKGAKRAGGKIYRLIYKPTGSDFCWHSPITELKKPVYGSSFIPYDCGGFDEMIPTVGECDWRGKHLPDHGEAWQLPWKIVAKGDDFLTLRCRLKVSPFEIERKLILVKDSARVNLQYRITNVGKEKWEYIWDCHGSVTPAARLGKTTKIFLPEETKVNVWWSKDERLGKQGTWHSWPITRDRDGKEIDLSLMGAETLGYADKLFTDRLKEGWIAAMDMEKNTGIVFAFPTDKIPYAGIWINQGGWRGYTQLGLEATNGCGDALNVAVKDYLKTYALLQPGQSEEFSLTIAVVQGISDIKRIGGK